MTDLLKGRCVGHSVIVERPLRSRGGGRAVDQERTKLVILLLVSWKQTVTGSKDNYEKKVCVSNSCRITVVTFPMN